MFTYQQLYPRRGLLGYVAI